ncbi:unnamed protein product [Chrysoparadoxa australica]
MRKLFMIGSEDHGRGRVLFSWQGEGNMLATAGTNGLVHVFDRHGEGLDEISLQGPGEVLSLRWDKDGESLAILQEGNGTILIWEQSSRDITSVDTSLKDPTFMCWSRTGPQLAVGTVKGNLLIYNKQSRKKNAVLGKHPKEIVCGAWSTSNKLALGGADASLTISSEGGDTLDQAELKVVFEHSHAFFTSPHLTSSTLAVTLLTLPVTSENCISIIMGKQSLLLYSLEDPDNPVELAFQSKYGKIEKHHWFGDGFMLLGFSEGYLVVISTHVDEIGEECFSGQFHVDGLLTMAYSPVLGRVASAGRDGVKVVDLKVYQEIEEDCIPMSSEDGRICDLAWSPDGQILTVATKKGEVFNFLAHMPTVHASYGTQVAYLSSLREICIMDGTDRNPEPLTIPVDIEPAFAALGARHVAVGMNNRVLFYFISADEPDLVGEQEYNGAVEDLCMNYLYAAALSNGQVVLHKIEMDHDDGGEQRKTFPEREEGGFEHATCIGMTDNFLIYGTRAGTVEMFYLPEWAMLGGAEMRHAHPIKRLCPNYLGTRLLVVDNTNEGYIFSPGTGESVPVPDLPTPLSHVMWDQLDRTVVMVCTEDELHSYVYTPVSVKGPEVTKLGPTQVLEDGSVKIERSCTRMPPGFSPVISYGGEVTCQVESGVLDSFTAEPFEHTDAGFKAPKEEQELCFKENLAILRLKPAWKAALRLDSRAHYLALSNRAMQVLDIQTAIHVYRQLGDAGMVIGLERIAHTEDKSQLAGHIALLFGAYAEAQDLFLKSSRYPLSALEMRCDLLQWDQALKLAHTLAPEKVPSISVSLGQQLEFQGESEAALQMYEDALSAAIDAGDEGVWCSSSDCTAGIARCTLRLGDIRRGVRLAKEANDEKLFRECAGILEEMRQPTEAAAMFESGELYERAAAIHISTKNLPQAGAIIEKVKLPKLLCQYARACEKAGDFVEAASSYERAHDMDGVVRLCLEELGQPEKAFEIVRQTCSSTGAELVSQYCQRISDWRGAIEFLLMAMRADEAFNLAKSHEQMELFSQVLGEGIGPDQALNVARYYEAQHEMSKAGNFYTLCGQYHRALKLYLQCGEKQVDAAIGVVGKARNDILTHTLIDFLMGETDGVPKDPNYIYRLYTALGNYSQAGKTAIVIARQEQDIGNYKVAHGILYETIRQLEDQGVRVPQSLRRSFVLLHSYTLGKLLVKRGDHAGAARMLLRVAKSISKFPSHIVPILTSTVIECQRAGLKSSAFEYASMLMRQEYRGLIDKKFRRSIESIVRRPGNMRDDDEEPEPLSECPISSEMIPCTQLESPQTKDCIPMCIVTGRHMEAKDWCICPRSKMPALMSEYMSYLKWQADQTPVVPDEEAVIGNGWSGMDPVTGQKLSSYELKKCTAEEVKDFIKQHNMGNEDKDKSKNEEEPESSAANPADIPKRVPTNQELGQ